MIINYHDIIQKFFVIVEGVILNHFNNELTRSA